MDEETGAAPSNPVPMGSVRAAALIAALVLAACGGDGSGASSATVPADGTTATSTTTSTTSTTTDPEAALEEEVEAAYYAQLDAFVDIFHDPDPTNPLIDQHFVGEQRETILNSVSRNIAEGTALRRPENPDHFKSEILSIDARERRATVIACTIDGLVVVRRETGQVVNDAVVTLRLSHEFLRTDDGSRRLQRTERLERTEGVAQCDG